MLKEYLQINTLSLVILGEFNPAIIQPFWLANKEIIREQEAQDAKIELIHNELSRMNIDDWLFLEVSKTRFELRTSKEPYFAPLRDVLISIFENLKETPISAIGINHLNHYGIPTEQKFYDIGNKLAPLTNWNNFLNDPRLINIEITEQNRKDKLPGHYRIKIQPSDQKLNTQYGLLLSINDHYLIKDDKNKPATELVKLVKMNWDNSFQRAQEIPLQLWKNLDL